MGRYVSGLGSDEKKLAMAQAKADAVARARAGLPPSSEPGAAAPDNTALYIGGAAVLAAVLLLKDKK